MAARKRAVTAGREAKKSPAAMQGSPDDRKSAKQAKPSKPAKQITIALPPVSEPAAPPASEATPPTVTPPPAPELAPEIVAELQHAALQGAAGGNVRLSAGAIARTLQEVAELLQLTNANMFKIRAYENAARALAGLGEDLDGMLEAGTLPELPGIGSSIAEKVATLAKTGQLPYLDELRAQVPQGLVDLLRIPGLGPKKAQALNSGLGINSVEELEAACRAGRLVDLRGFGAKTAENILLGIDQLRRVRGTFLGSMAREVVEPVLETLVNHPAVQRAEFAGSLRRRKELVHDVDIVLATNEAGPVMAAFAGGTWVERLLGSGETKTSIMHSSGLQIDLRAVTDAQYPYALHHFTGSKEHNIAMRGRAIRIGLKMNEYGLFRGEELVPCRDETEIFAQLGLAYIPPELREDRGEIEAAESGELPPRLLEPGDLHGALHVHTTASSGRGTLEEMVRAARDLGWQWIGISDHGPGAAYANGLDPQRIAAQRREIESVRKTVPGIEVLHGIETEILPDGRLDLDDATLASLDFVIAAIHGAFELGRDEQTRRILRAIENPQVSILGHPTSRILVERPGIEFDLPQVLNAAARLGVAAEMNVHPQRMDLDGAAAHAARDHDVLVSISPDAHDPAGLAALEAGVGLARRGWLESRHVLNTKSAEELRAHLRDVRTRRAKTA